jgi:hypothetical protein
MDNRKIIRPRTNKVKLLHDYISSCRKYVYCKELEAIGCWNLDLSLKHYTRKYGVTFIKLDKFRYKIK